MNVENYFSKYVDMQTTLEMEMEVVIKDLVFGKQ
jgi:hypothetical protein